MKVHWTESAEAHLDAIYAYIAQDSQTYALRMVDRITKRSQQIGSFFGGLRFKTTFNEQSVLLRSGAKGAADPDSHPPPSPTSPHRTHPQ